MRLSLLFALVAALGAGCSMMELSQRQGLLKAIEENNESRRWNGGDGLERLREGRRVTDSRIRGVKLNGDKDKAVVRLEIEGYRMPLMTIERWFVEQEWMEKNDDWVLVKEKEISASVARRPLGMAPVRPDPKALEDMPSLKEPLSR